MAWIELHQSLRNHPKILHLKVLLGAQDKDLVRAKLENLWLWALDYCLNGRLTVAERPLSAAEIAEAAEWSGDGAVFLQSLIAAGWIDERPGGKNGKTLYLHDWQDYAGRLLSKRESERKRVAEYRENGRTRTVHSTYTEPTAPTVPITVPTNQLTERGGYADATPPPPPALKGGGTAENLASVYRNSVRKPISQERATTHIQAALSVGVKAQDIEAAFMDPSNRGREIWSILDPLRKAQETRPKRLPPSKAAPRCSVCNDSGLTGGGVQNGKVMMIPCSCKRQAVAK